MPQLQTPPLSLYIHLPWCISKCPYCDFNSHALKDQLPEAGYVDSLIADLDQDLELGENTELETVFLGGGTPSLFSPAAISRILTAVRDRFDCSAGFEVTLEVNPGTHERGRFEAYVVAGVNRVSLGVQSFSDARLALLGRIHTATEAIAAATEARKAGIATLNLDVMFGLPGQSVAEAVADVEQAIELEPDHLSHYQLTLEPGTSFYKQPPALPDEEAAFEMTETTGRVLEAAGFKQYEVSAWARPRKQCRHNLNCWQFGDYLGIGAGAHGKLTDPHSGRILRLVKRRNPATYMKTATTEKRLESITAVGNADRAFEYLLNALRLRSGFSRGAFEARTGLSLAEIRPALTEAGRRRLLRRVGDRWLPTDLGYRFLNDLQALFLPAGTPAGADQPEVRLNPGHRQISCR